MATLTAEQLVIGLEEVAVVTPAYVAVYALADAHLTRVLPPGSVYFAGSILITSRAGTRWAWDGTTTRRLASDWEVGDFLRARTSREGAALFGPFVAQVALADGSLGPSPTAAPGPPVAWRDLAFDGTTLTADRIWYTDGRSRPLPSPSCQLAGDRLACDNVGVLATADLSLLHPLPSTRVLGAGEAGLLLSTASTGGPTTLADLDGARLATFPAATAWAAGPTAAAVLIGADLRVYAPDGKLRGHADTRALPSLGHPVAKADDLLLVGDTVAWVNPVTGQVDAELPPIEPGWKRTGDVWENGYWRADPRGWSLAADAPLELVPLSDRLLATRAGRTVWERRGPADLGQRTDRLVLRIAPLTADTDTVEVLDLKTGAPVGRWTVPRHSTVALGPTNAVLLQVGAEWTLLDPLGGRAPATGRGTVDLTANTLWPDWVVLSSDPTARMASGPRLVHVADGRTWEGLSSQARALTARTADGSVVAPFLDLRSRSGWLALIAPTGERWRIPAAGAAQVRVAGDLVLVAGGGTVTAYDVATGVARWVTPWDGSLVGAER